MKKNKLFINTISTIINRIVFVISGFIIPRMMIVYYGSEINGLVVSITQFLGLISFMELGVGSVVQSALYKPLVDLNNELISKTLISARKFFRNIAKIFCFYILLLIVVYPLLSNGVGDFIYVSSLIVILSIATFAEYYFGITNLLLLYSDQKAYICMFTMAITQMISIIACIVMMKAGATVHIMKLLTAFIFILRPITYHIYVNRNYDIDYTLKYDDEPIKQKWSGFAQHISAVVVSKTDVAVLTIFASLKDVSIYSIYFMIANSVELLINNIYVGLQSSLGHIVALSDNVRLQKYYRKMEVLFHVAIVLLFSICYALIIPFLKLYTKGIDDANYINRILAFLICVVGYINCVRGFYSVLIKAEYAYKETQSSAIIEAILNLVISILLVFKFGLVGVTVGTILAGIYRIVYFCVFINKHYIFDGIWKTIKIFLFDVFMLMCAYLLTNRFSQYVVNTYYDFVVLGIIVTFVFSIIAIIFVSVFHYKFIIEVLKEKI